MLFPNAIAASARTRQNVVLLLRKHFSNAAQAVWEPIFALSARNLTALDCATTSISLSKRSACMDSNPTCSVGNRMLQSHSPSGSTRTQDTWLSLAVNKSLFISAPVPDSTTGAENFFFSYRDSFVFACNGISAKCSCSDGATVPGTAVAPPAVNATT